MLLSTHLKYISRINFDYNRYVSSYDIDEYNYRKRFKEKYILEEEFKRFEKRYVKINQFIILSVLRFVLVYRYNEIISVTRFDDILPLYLILFFRSMNKRFNRYVYTYFDVVILDGKKVYIESIEDFYRILRSSYDTLVFQGVDNIEYRFNNMVVFDAIIEIMKRTLTSWKQEYKDYLSSYRLSDEELKEIKDLSKILKDNSGDNISDNYYVIKKILEFFYNKQGFETLLKTLYPVNVETLENNDRYYYDIISIINFQNDERISIPQDELTSQEILNSGHYLQNFDLINLYQTEVPTVRSKLSDVLKNVPNFNLSASIKFSEHRDDIHYKLLFSYPGIDPDDEIPKSYNTTYSDSFDIQSTNSQYHYDSFFKIDKNKIKELLVNYLSKELFNYLFFRTNFSTNTNDTAQYKELVSKSVTMFKEEYFNPILDDILSRKNDTYFNITTYGLRYLFENNSTSALFSRYDSVAIELIDKLTEQTTYDQIITRISSIFQDNIYIDFPLLIKRSFYSIFNEILDRLIHITELLETGYAVQYNKKVLNEFVKTIMKDFNGKLFKYKLEDIISFRKLKNFISSYFTNILPPLIYSMYSDIVTSSFRYTKYRIQSKFLYIDPNEIDSLTGFDLYNIILQNYYVINCNKLSLNYYFDQFKNNFYLDLEPDDFILFYKSYSNIFYHNIDYTKGRFSVTNDYFYKSKDYNLLTLLNYKKDDKVDHNRYYRYVKMIDYMFYPVNFFTNYDNLVPVNYEVYINVTYGYNYYIDISAEKYFNPELIEQINNVVEQTDLSKFLILTDTTRSKIKFHPIKTTYSFYNSRYLSLPLTIKHIVLFDKKMKYITYVKNSKEHNLIYTGINQEILYEYIKSINKFIFYDDFKILDLIDRTGRNFETEVDIYQRIQTIIAFLFGEFDRINQYKIYNVENLTEFKRLARKTKINSDFIKLLI